MRLSKTGRQLVAQLRKSIDVTIKSRIAQPRDAPLCKPETFPHLRHRWCDDRSW